MIVVAPEISLLCEVYQAQYYLRPDIPEEAFLCLGGQVMPPETPSLGIRQDLDKLDQLAK
ncbi:MAG: hypothetical protein AAGH70_01930 [Pseudomonadota bacterium]